MAASIIHDFDPVFAAIDAVQDSVTPEEYDALNDTLKTAIESVVSRIMENTNVSAAELSGAYSAYVVTLRHAPQAAEAFTNGARWSASKVVSSTLTLPIVEITEDTPEPKRRINVTGLSEPLPDTNEAPRSNLPMREKAPKKA
jgi:hypothetical protein